MSERALTLRRRKIALTLPHRHISGGNIAYNVAQFFVLHGHRYGGGVNIQAFLTRGLIGELYDNDSASTLTLRRRKIALTLEG